MSHTPRRPRGRPRSHPLEEQQASILRAARATFAANGVQGTTYEGIARAAGVSRTLIHRLFGTKEQLFATLVEDTIGELVGALAAQFDTTAELPERERTRSNVAIVFELMAERPETVRIVRLARATGFGEADKRLAEGIGTIEAQLVPMLIGTWQGGLSADDAELLAAMLIAGVEAAAFSQLDHPTRSTEAAVDFVTDFLRGGFRWLVEHPDRSPLPSLLPGRDNRRA